jgi:hypothetical protein
MTSFYVSGAERIIRFMEDTESISRRRALELTGVGGTMAVAGCMDQLGSGGRGGDREVMISIQPDPQEMRSRQQELRQRVLAGNVTQQEARREMQELQQEVMSNAIDTVDGEIADSNIAVEDQMPNQGLVLISGSDTEVLDLLDVEPVEAIAPSSTYEEVKAQQQQQQQRPTPESPDSNESTGNQTTTGDQTTTGNQTTTNSS